MSTPQIAEYMHTVLTLDSILFSFTNRFHNDSHSEMCQLIVPVCFFEYMFPFLEALKYFDNNFN